MRLIYATLFFLIGVCNFTYATMPSNDDVCSAQDLGTPQSPDPCPFGYAYPAFAYSQNMSGSTRQFPAHKLMGCYFNNNNMATTGGDLWYKFTASSNKLKIYLLNNTINNPFIGLYHLQNGCMNLVPVDCWQGTSAECPNITEGQTYYIQVLDIANMPSGTFDLEIKCEQYCGGCEEDIQLYAYPPPINGYYHPGDTIEFTFIINNYRRIGANRFHSLFPRFLQTGGWDINSLTFTRYPFPGNGAWSDYTFNNPDFSNARMFAYEPNNFQTEPDGNPANNRGDSLGDNNSGTWMFQWRIRTNPNPTIDMPLNMEVYSYSDNETGNWPIPGCRRDTFALFNATLTKCVGPDLLIASPACPSICTGTVVGVNEGNLPNYSFSWYYPTGGTVQTPTGNTTNPVDTLTGLCEGEYILISSYDNGNCFSSTSFQVNASLQTYLSSYGFSGCSNGNFGYAFSTVTGGSGTYTYSWSPSGITTSSSTNLPAGYNTLYVTDTATNCVDTITVFLAPQIIDGFFTYPDTVICNLTTLQPIPNYVDNPGGTFSIFPSNGPVINPQTGEISNYFSSTGYYDIIYTPSVTNSQCADKDTFTIKFTTSFDTNMCYCPNTFCANASFTYYPTLATPGGVFSLVSGPGPMNINASDGSFDPIGMVPGVYFVKYDATNLGNCGFSQTETIIIVNPQPTIANGPNFSFCIGDVIPPITATYSGSPILWFDDIVNQIVSPNQNTINGQLFPPQNLTEGTYDFFAATFVLMPNGDTCYGFSQCDITIKAKPNIFIGNDTTVCSGFTAQLNANGGTLADNYAWSTGAITQGISVNPTANTQYFVIATNQDGCTDMDTINVIVDNGSACTDSLGFFNGITPNGDGFNEAWIIDGITNIRNNWVIIYNRWGEKVWEKSNYDNVNVVFVGKNQNDTELPTGTYYFVVQLPNKQHKGWIELTR
jgi:gliding motility-associated-like protein